MKKMYTIDRIVAASWFVGTLTAAAVAWPEFEVLGRWLKWVMELQPL